MVGDVTVVCDCGPRCGRSWFHAEHGIRRLDSLRRLDQPDSATPRSAARDARTMIGSRSPQLSFDRCGLGAQEPCILGLVVPVDSPLRTVVPGTEPDDLRRFRRNVGLTQGALADRVGVTPLTVHRWETGQSRPQRIARERLRDIAEGYATDPAFSDQTETSPESRPPLDFAGRAEAGSAVAEALRLAYGHQFNPVFASETSRIDPLPHQRIAVYEHMLKQDPLRFLLADDAGAGKTIMTGLIVREMLTRGRIRRVLVA